MKKLVFTLSVIACSLALMSGSAFAAEKQAKEKNRKECGCCKATVEAGKACAEACCTKAAANGKVCEKCHPSAEQGKAKAKGKEKAKDKETK